MLNFEVKYKIVLRIESKGNNTFDHGIIPMAMWALDNASPLLNCQLCFTGYNQQGQALGRKCNSFMSQNLRY